VSLHKAASTSAPRISYTNLSKTASTARRRDKEQCTAALCHPIERESVCTVCLRIPATLPSCRTREPTNPINQSNPINNKYIDTRRGISFIETNTWCSDQHTTASVWCIKALTGEGLGSSTLAVMPPPTALSCGDCGWNCGCSGCGPYDTLP
jgi:hypothetical protein